MVYLFEQVSEQTETQWADVLAGGNSVFKGRIYVSSLFKFIVFSYLIFICVLFTITFSDISLPFYMLSSNICTLRTWWWKTWHSNSDLAVTPVAPRGLNPSSL